MNSNHDRAVNHADQAASFLQHVLDMADDENCAGFTPALAVQIAGVHAALAAFWQREPDVADRALVA